MPCRDLVTELVTVVADFVIVADFVVETITVTLALIERAAREADFFVCDFVSEPVPLFCVEERSGPVGERLALGRVSVDPEEVRENAPDGVGVCPDLDLLLRFFCPTVSDMVEL